MRRFLLLTVVCAAVVGASAPPAHAQASSPLLKYPGMRLGGSITRDTFGIPSVWAINSWDLFYLQGYVHATDRLFQMDTTRRQASGTLAELLGSVALSSDVQLRTMGLRRAAIGSLAAASPQLREALDAYSAGVNQWIATHALPPEYGALDLTKFEPWTPLDSVTIAKALAFQLSFDLDTTPTIALLTYQGVGKVAGFDGTKLFSEDLWRSTPFDPFTTLGSANASQATGPGSMGLLAVDETGIVVETEEARTARLQALSNAADEMLARGTLDLALAYEEKARQVPLLKAILDHERPASSNEWAIAARLTANGQPLVANDPHLVLSAPSIWYPISLRGGGFNVAGNSFAGAPFVIHGQNDHVAWGSTVNPMDVTDTFQETIAPAPGTLVGLGTVYKGTVEALVPIPEVFRTNNPGSGSKDKITVVPAAGSIPPATLLVPRRDYGPIITPDTLGTGSALSIQYTGWSRTHELEAFMLIDLAKSVDDVKAAIQRFDFGSQNFAVADTGGNIAYLTSAEMPVREDLQSNTVKGAPPWFIRNGTGGNEWLPAPSPLPADQAVPHQVLPYSEMPQVVNPAAGWFANGNNDPVGTAIGNNPLGRQRPGGGIYYLDVGYGYDGFRGGRIAQLIKKKIAAGVKFTRADLKAIQADAGMIDAQVFVPYITTALANAMAAGADPTLAALGQNPAIAAAVARLGDWDFSTPTGLKEGFDPGKAAGVDPTSAQVKASVPATLFAVWRSQFIANTIDAVLKAYKLPLPPNSTTLVALRNLLDNFSTSKGVGASGMNFFQVPTVPEATRAEDRRDILILKSVADGLALLSSDAFAPAFAKSTNLDDYRWGKLHRIVFEHPLGGPFNIPTAGGAFPNPLGNALPGIPRQGGWATIDRSDNDARASTVNGFMFTHGSSRRYVGEATPSGIVGDNTLPGGVSGVLGDPNYFSLLPLWLTNQYYPLTVQAGPVIPWQ